MRKIAKKPMTQSNTKPKLRSSTKPRAATAKPRPTGSGVKPGGRRPATKPSQGPKPASNLRRAKPVKRPRR